MKGLISSIINKILIIFKKVKLMMKDKLRNSIEIEVSNWERIVKKVHI